jgi:hypothetical protein
MFLRRQNTSIGEVTTVDVDVVDVGIGSVGSSSHLKTASAHIALNTHDAHDLYKPTHDDDGVALVAVVSGGEMGVASKNSAMSTTNAAVSVSHLCLDIKGKGVIAGENGAKGTSGATSTLPNAMIMTDKIDPKAATPRPPSTVSSSWMSDIARHNSKRFDRVVDTQYSVSELVLFRDIPILVLILTLCIVKQNKPGDTSSINALLLPIRALFPGSGSATRSLAPAFELKLPVNNSKNKQSKNNSTTLSSHPSTLGKSDSPHGSETDDSFSSKRDYDDFVIHQPPSWSAKRTTPSDAVAAYTYDWRIDAFGDSPVAVRGQRTHYPKPKQSSSIASSPSPPQFAGPSINPLSRPLCKRLVSIHLISQYNKF